LRDHSHIPLDDSDVCAHCGQLLPGRKVATYGQQGPRRAGLIATIALHLLLVAIWLVQPKSERHAPPKAGEAVVWLPPLKPNKPTPQAAQAAPKQSAKSAPSKPKPSAAARRGAAPAGHDHPAERKAGRRDQAAAEGRNQAAAGRNRHGGLYREAPPGARRPQRAAGGGERRPARHAQRLANIAAINGRGGQDPNETGGVFSVTNKTFSRADVKFRGWNPNFKRRWLTAVTVERGSDPDIETAIVKKMIELIRKEKTGDFEWDSHRLNKVVTLSARPQDTKELMDFLYKEMFPDYKPPR
jgi:hypothetical protein